MTARRQPRTRNRRRGEAEPQATEGAGQNAPEAQAEQPAAEQRQA